ncbi:hypothetical protein [Streptomyces sp. NPDC056672]|uniref:hypothetical protein n=1 Tax=Streptomyces sp. NPDC056672 TaxID=3345906 RepID=UPI0036A15624
MVLASACSVAGGGGGTYGLQRQAAASPAPTGPAGLTAKALKTDSIPGATVTTPTGDQAPGAEDVETDAPCRPLARAVAGAVLGSPEDAVTRRVTGDGLVTTVTLASYRHEEKAVAALTDLSTAADACADGFDHGLGRGPGRGEERGEDRRTPCRTAHDRRDTAHRPRMRIEAGSGPGPESGLGQV